MSWKQVSVKTKGKEKVDFVKETSKLHSRENNLANEIFNQPQAGMSKQEFEDWLKIDNSAEVVFNDSQKYVKLLETITAKKMNHI